MSVIFTVVVQIWLAYDKKQQVDKAVKETVRLISDDYQLREQMIKHIIENRDFQLKI